MFQTQNNDAEIDLRELWNVIWRGKWIIIVVTAIFAVVSASYVLSLPNIYRSEALLAPTDADQNGGFTGVAGQLGGLASLAGVNLGSPKVDKIGMAIEILKSREFFAKFATKHRILPDLMAVKGWDMATNEMIYNEDIYSPNTNEWLREVSLPKLPKPSLQEAKREFDKLLLITNSAETGMITISIEHYSPETAKLWVDWLIQDINLVMKERDKDEAIRSISYLQSQISETNIVGQKTLLYQLIEEQAKTLMFAEVRDEYVFKTIDPALVPELKFKPKRALIVIIGILLGGGLSMILVFIRHFRNL
tara:strand:+ start:207 stop:1124 length:918 start_codon:yes stop_codon:yes gene_type:complete